MSIFVINNNGGQIFKRLPYSNHKIKDFDKYWITPLKTKIKDAAVLFNLNYFSMDAKKINKNLFRKIDRGVNIIEICIKNKDDVKFLDTIKKTFLV